MFSIYEFLTIFFICGTVLLILATSVDTVPKLLFTNGGLQLVEVFILINLIWQSLTCYYNFQIFIILIGIIIALQSYLVWTITKIKLEASLILIGFGFPGIYCLFYFILNAVVSKFKILYMKYE